LALVGTPEVRTVVVLVVRGVVVVDVVDVVVVVSDGGLRIWFSACVPSCKREEGRGTYPGGRLPKVVPGVWPVVVAKRTNAAKSVRAPASSDSGNVAA
jgi:hypothetical protein